MGIKFNYLTSILILIFLLGMGCQGISGEDKNMNNKFTRRKFIKTSAAASLAAVASPMTKAFAAGSDKLRIGIVGPGGRGGRAVAGA